MCGIEFCVIRFLLASRIRKDLKLLLKSLLLIWKNRERIVRIFSYVQEADCEFQSGIACYD